MKVSFVFLVMSVLVLVGMVSAAGTGNITLSAEHSDYYFQVGEEAQVPITTNNTYGVQVSGTLTAKTTQQINQNGFYMSSTNANSAGTTISPGENTMVLNFGSSNSEGTVSADLQFDYNVNGSKTVYLNGITVHFVSNSTQQSSGQQVSSTSQQNQQSQQQGQQNQQQGNQNQGQQSQNDQIYNKLQQNQMAQDSSALKQQIKQQVSEQQQMEQAFQKNLKNNSQVSQAMQDLQDKGFNQTGTKLNPTANNTGTFNMSYSAKNGTKMSLHGRMENGTITKLEVTDLSKKKVQNSDYFSYLVVVLAAIALVLIYLVKRKKRRAVSAAGAVIEEPKRPFDYAAEAKKLLEQAKSLFSEGKYKDAYGMANRALRIYLAYSNGLDSEMTNDALIKHLKDARKPFKEIKECFDLCSLVEFAKYKPNDKDFGRIIDIVGVNISKRDN